MKKIIPLLFLLCTFFHSLNLHAQATGFDNASIAGRTAINVNLVRDFGADPTGAINSTWAFIKAARYIQNLWNKSGIPLTSGSNINYTTQYVVLNIPWGTYKVGRQVDLKTFQGGTYYLYNSTTDAPASIITIPYYQLFPEANINPAQNSKGYYFYTSQYKAINGGNDHYYGSRYICTDIFSFNNNTTNYLNGIIIQDTSDGVHGSGVVNIKDSDNLRIGYLDTAHANDAGIAPFGYVRDVQASCFRSMGPMNFSIGYPYAGGEGTNQWSDSAIMNVKIQRINIDGNNINYYFGGRQSVTGYWLRPELGTYGITFYSTKNVTVQNCNLIRMGTDGMYVNDAAYKSPTNMVLRNVTCDSCGRQGISITAVSGLVVDSCNFRYTGRLKTIHAHGDSALFALPAAGMDIEPEAGDDIYHGYINSKRGNFNATVSNSKFLWNSEYNICQIQFTPTTYGNGNDTNYYSKNWHFVNDLFENDTVHLPADEPTSYQGIRVGQPFFKFSNCTIHDYINPLANPYYIYNGETIFDTCTFADRTNQGGHMPNGTQLIPNYETLKRFTLNGCTLTLNDTTSMGMIASTLWSGTPAALMTEDSDYTRIRNCTFNFNNNGRYYLGPFWVTGLSCIFRYVRFQGINTINSLATTNPNMVEANGIIYEGSNAACSPNALNLNGPIWLWHYPVNAAHPKYDRMSTGYKYATTTSPSPIDSLGYFNFVTSKKALLYVQGDATSSEPCSVYLNKNSSLLCSKTGGVYFSLANVYQRGKIITLDSSYMAFNIFTTPTTYFYNTNPYYYIHRNTFWGFNAVYGLSSQNMTPFDSAYNASVSVNISPYTGIYRTISGGNAYITAPYNSTNVNALKLTAASNEIVADNTGRLKTLANTSGDFSIQLGFRDTVSSTYQSLFATSKYSNSTSGNSDIEVGINATNHPYIKFGNATSLTSTTAITPNTNYLLTVTRVSNFIRLYINCIATDSGLNSYGVNNANAGNDTLFIGNSYFPYQTNPFLGYLYLSRVWKRALSLAEVQAAYTSKQSYKDTALVVDFEFRDSTTIGNTFSDDVSVPLDSCHQLHGSITGTTPKWVPLSYLGTPFGTCPLHRPAVTTSLPIPFSMNVYPNPNHGQFNLLLQNSKSNTVAVLVYDINGTKVYSKQFTLLDTGDISIPLNISSKLSEGIYLIKVTNSDGVYSKKILIK